MTELCLPLMSTSSIGSFSKDRDDDDNEDDDMDTLELSIEDDWNKTNILLDFEGIDTGSEEEFLLNCTLDIDSHYQVPEGWKTALSTSGGNTTNDSKTTLETVVAPTRAHQDVFRQVSNDQPVVHELGGSKNVNPTSITLDSMSDQHMTDLNKPENDNQKDKQATNNIGPDSSQMESINRIVLFLQRNEEDRTMVRDVEDLVREAEYHHRQGERKYQNLPGTILEKLIARLGGDFLAQIYQQTQLSIRRGSNNPNNYEHQSVNGPTALQLGIAFGVHLARLHSSSVSQKSSNEAPESPLVMDYVVRGEQQVRAMSEQERQMFWNYVTTSGHYYT